VLLFGFWFAWLSLSWLGAGAAGAGGGGWQLAVGCWLLAACFLLLMVCGLLLLASCLAGQWAVGSSSALPAAAAAACAARRTALHSADCALAVRLSLVIAANRQLLGQSPGQ
jgi:hypothetical protein